TLITPYIPEQICKRQKRRGIRTALNGPFTQHCSHRVFHYDFTPHLVFSTTYALHPACKRKRKKLNGFVFLQTVIDGSEHCIEMHRVSPVRVSISVMYFLNTDQPSFHRCRRSLSGHQDMRFQDDL